MKNVKIALMIASVMVVVPSAYGMDQTKDKMLMTLTGVHTRVFSADNLFASPVDFGPWNGEKGLMNQVKTFVVKNASNDTILLTALKDLTVYNTQLITNIQNAYKAVKKGLTRADMAQYATAFLTLKGKFIQVENTLNNGSFILQGKKDARDVLVRLAMSLGASANAAANNLKKQPIAATAPARPRAAQAGVAANPPRPIPQAMARKPLPVPPTRAKAIKK